MALWLIPMVYVGVALCFGIVFLRFEHEHLSQHAVLLSQWFFNDFSIASPGLPQRDSVRYDRADSYRFHRRLYYCSVQLRCLFAARGIIFR